MWALTKPPIINKLFLWFFWYEEKLLVSKVYNLKLKKLLAVEKFSIYFLLYKFSLLWTLRTQFLKFEKHFLQIFQLSLVVKTTLKKFWINKSIFTITLQTMVEYSWFFFWKDFTVGWSKFFYNSKIKPRVSQTKFITLKTILLTNKNFFFQSKFVLINQLTTVFFLNIFFFSLFIAFHHNKLSFNLKHRKKIFYFGLDFCKNFFISKYEQIFNQFNKFLTIQTGVLKRSSFFIDRNYIFATSAQLLRAKKNFFFKFFFKNSWFRIFKEKFKPITNLTKNILIDGTYTWSWSLEILPSFINKIIYIYNGHLFTWIRILPGMVGFKLGQFSFTRKIHSRNVNLKNLFKNIIN